MFVNRQEELASLNQILSRSSPSSAQLLLLYGRRRVGKSALLNHWVEYSGMAVTYWLAVEEPPALQRRSLYAALTNVPLQEAPLMESWDVFFQWLASHLSDDYGRQIIIMDDFPHACDADDQLLPALQNAWDQQLRYGNTIFLLCGSQLKTMQGMLDDASPLAGRITGEWQLQPLPFHTLRQFFPSWNLDQRIALYHMVGGVPAYLSWLDPDLSLLENIQQVILDPSRLFLIEPKILLYDELRELSKYTAVLGAIANGNHALSAISRESLISRTSLTFYLNRLQKMGLVQRQLPVTLDEDAQKRSKRGRYYLLDPFFQFYFRFLAPHLRLQRQPQETTALIEKSLPAIGRDGFVELAREWIKQQAQSNRATSPLPFVPEVIGRHWSRGLELDVVALNWRTQDILLGACDWKPSATEAALIVDLAGKKTDRIRRELPNQGYGWNFHYAIFTRTGLTEAAQGELLPLGGLNVHLSRLERGLGG